MSDSPRDRDPDPPRATTAATGVERADATTIGPPAVGAGEAGAHGETPRPDSAGGNASGEGSGRTRTARLAPAGPEDDPRRRRRRRWFIGGIAAGAALVVVALCAGGLAVVSAVADFRGDTGEARVERHVRDTACLELEQRLNRLVPPGATATPAARAVAVRDENAAVRLYVAQLQGERTEDMWRQLLDARTSFSEALDAQTKSRTPAFFVAPRTGGGGAVADELVRLSPAACSGLIRRLAAPEL
ncbi:hypothetical protein [Couchioplanes caeruleus]|uniref:Uncharacterized protein n=2 Tax=Couchioplanes caeruleus TaxID=56438 RepID=A0A1K0FNN7_9ACTN|nr:hypothetical protein [Couchioplanes caeruleus]OJF14401.1 hypothetical protein BG844_09875 [Couchioplanes caeruleus subsp. caeruleus]ROP32017.1 hypothetical protein EDD30_4945 [Couchioplanes caeruleus]